MQGIDRRWLESFSEEAPCKVEYPKYLYIGVLLWLTRSKPICSGMRSDGLRAYSLSAGRPSHLLLSSLYSIIDPIDNYAQYLGRYYSINGGILFLVAHVREYELHSEAALQSFLYFIKSTLPVDKCQRRYIIS
ncbi:uncharacterized protein N7498_001623 [Penicillium cinerascens]|uniref:Uncharacterized protein n=1 Tax=Penicillium cinerascens TaxID=70096 RepID=A0A9W9N8K0_9EURO|nr:uncharacterized protein N7498_001623 [Penicillium cinerascens]KAJ5215216.1 hypothetical protein N7498_001623 [Penicillium cinerascens]